jgi:hypothetical protein
VIFGVLIWVTVAAVRGVWNGGIGKGFMPAFMTALIGATVGLWLYENVLSKSGGSSTTKSEDDGYSGAGQGKDF